MEKAIKEKIRWTPEKKAKLVEEIRTGMKEGRTFQSIAQEIADRLGVRYSTIVWKYYKTLKENMKENIENIKEGLKKSVDETGIDGKVEISNASATEDVTGTKAGISETAGVTDNPGDAGDGQDFSAKHWGVRMSGKPWTPEEDAMILEGVAKGLDFATIASKMNTGRSGGAVRSRYNELVKSIEEKAKANVARRQAVDRVEALNKAYKLLIAKSRTTKDGRLDSEALEEISAAVGLSYAQVMSLWGFINQRGFWMKAEIYKLEGIIASQKVEIELLRRKIKEQEEEIKELKIAAYNVQQIINKINTSA